MAEEMSPDNDGRKKGEWPTRYPWRAWVGIVVDTVWTVLLGIASMLALFCIWHGNAFAFLSSGCPHCSAAHFNRFAYLIVGGVIGGLLFGVKYLYKVVAHGYWHTDRRIWRLLSPFLAGGLALAVGALIDSGIAIFTIKNTSNTAFFSVGFITGYFADSAVAKLQDVARGVFGSKPVAQSMAMKDGRKGG